MLRPTSLETEVPKDQAETVVESEPRPKGEFEGWEVGEDDLT
jgi:hypothetical protein